MKLQEEKKDWIKKVFRRRRERGLADDKHYKRGRMRKIKSSNNNYKMNCEHN